MYSIGTANIKKHIDPRYNVYKNKLKKYMNQTL